MKKYFLLLTLLSSITLAAQVYPTTRGLFLNLHVGAASVAYDDVNDESAGGGGVGLRAGYGITPTTTLYLGIAGYNISGNSNTIFLEDYPVGIFEIGSRFHFGKKVKPLMFYLDVALQGVRATPFDEPAEVTLNGGGLAVAPGLMYFFTDRLAIDAQLRLGGGRINEFESGNLSVDVSDENFNYGLSRLTVGMTFFPF
ncbi:hypothetical protein CEQ90_07245 [Lewinellaceae bacterium SD302]|nr:hypothetical protein CEQ90_07245 [Lewinellaceae bacterium SD302]